MLLRFVRVQLYVLRLGDAGSRAAAQAHLGDALVADALGLTNPVTGRKVRLGLFRVAAMAVIGFTLAFTLQGDGSYSYNSAERAMTPLDVALFVAWASALLGALLLPVRVVTLVVGLSCKIFGVTRAAGTELDELQLDEFKKAYGR